MTSNNYLAVKRRYFANIGIKPPSPPSVSSFPSPPKQTNNLSPPSENGFSKSSVSIEKSFEVPLDDIFQFEDDISSNATSTPMSIPSSSMNKNTFNFESDEDDSNSFVPPHLLSSSSSSYSGHSFTNFKYQQRRKAAKLAY